MMNDTFHEQPQANIPRERLMQSHMTTEQALELCDMLPAVEIDEMIGRWRGFEVSTNHPLDGLLEPFGWYGKQFSGPDEVHPLLFGDKDHIFSVDPKWIPLKMVLNWRFTHGKLACALFRATRGLMKTNEAHACLRRVEYRGKTGAAMVYDQLPVIDAFRLIDHDTLLGLMDLRGMARPFVFRLHRDKEFPVR